MGDIKSVVELLKRYRDLSYVIYSEVQNGHRERGLMLIREFQTEIELKIEQFRRLDSQSDEDECKDNYSHSQTDLKIIH